MAILFLETGRTLQHQTDKILQKEISMGIPLNSLLGNNSHRFNHRSCQPLIIPLSCFGSLYRDEPESKGFFAFWFCFSVACMKYICKQYNKSNV